MRVISIATRNWLDGPWIECRWRLVFNTSPNRPWYNGCEVSFPGVKRLGRDLDHPPQLRAEVIDGLACNSTSLLGVRVLAWTSPFTNSMQQNPSWQAKRFSNCHEIPCILWKLEVYYYIHQSSPPSISWATWIQSISPFHFWRSILLSSFHILLLLPSSLFPSGFPCMHLSSPPFLATCPAHLIVLDFITRIMFGDIIKLPVM